MLVSVNSLETEEVVDMTDKVIISSGGLLISKHSILFDLFVDDSEPESIT